MLRPTHTGTDLSEAENRSADNDAFHRPTTSLWRLFLMAGAMVTWSIQWSKASTAQSRPHKYWTNFIGHLLNFVISILVVTVLFATIFRLLPNAQVAWGEL